MAIIKGNASQTSVSRVGEGVETYMRMLRDGTVGIADLIALWSLEGRVFTVSAGAGTTPATFGGGALNLAEMDLHIAVPAGVVIIPLSWKITFEAFGTTQILECCLEYGTGSVVGTATADTPSSSNANAGIASQCTCNVASATGTALTSVVEEIWHDGAQIAVAVSTGSSTAYIGKLAPQRYVYNALEDGILHVIGPSQQLVGLCSAQAGTGFFQFKYAELPAASVE